MIHFNHKREASTKRTWLRWASKVSSPLHFNNGFNLSSARQGPITCISKAWSHCKTLSSRSLCWSNKSPSPSPTRISVNRSVRPTSSPPRLELSSRLLSVQFVLFVVRLFIDSCLYLLSIISWYVDVLLPAFLGKKRNQKSKPWLKLRNVCNVRLDYLIFFRLTQNKTRTYILTYVVIKGIDWLKRTNRKANNDVTDPDGFIIRIIRPPNNLIKSNMFGS